jgi:hypothetical protein
MSVHDLLNKMASAEDAFLQTEFMAPVLPGGRVQVRIAGIVCTLRVAGAPQPGWAILKPLSLKRAKVVGEPSLSQVRDYLSLFPAFRLLLVSRTEEEGGWLALPASQGDARLQTDGPVQVRLVTGVQSFQQVIARFDGGRFWFQEVDRRRSPAIAAYLRQAFAAEVAPDALRKRTLTAEERAAYGLAYRAVEEARRHRVEVRLSEALEHGGARLASYIERADTYTVTWTLEGRTYHTTVRKDDLSVQVAGICLGGGDRRFDLQSIVGVVREAERGRRIVRVGEGAQLEEDAYWQIHPPVDE